MKIVLEIEPKAKLTGEQLLASAEDLAEAFNDGAFSHFFDYGRTKGEVKVTPKIEK